jgi:hypothetical protein
MAQAATARRPVNGPTTIGLSGTRDPGVNAGASTAARERTVNGPEDHRQAETLATDSAPQYPTPKRKSLLESGFSRALAALLHWAGRQIPKRRLCAAGLGLDTLACRLCLV